MQDSWQDRMTLAGYLSQPSSGLHPTPLQLQPRPPSQPPPQHPPKTPPLCWNQNQTSSSSSSSDRASHSAAASSLIDPSRSSLEDIAAAASVAAPCASSENSESTLKEHDYIGLAEVSSSSASSSVLQQVNDADVAADGLNLELGLGPVKDSPKDVNGSSCDAKVAVAAVDKHASVPQKGQYIKMVHGHEASYSCGGATAQAKQPGPAVDTSRSASEHIPANAVMPPPLKNGMKRIFSETMVEPALYVTEDSRPGTALASTGGGPAAAMRQLQDRDMMAYTAHQKPMFLSNWTGPKSSSLVPWQSALEQPVGSYATSSGTKSVGVQAPKADKAMDASWNTEHTISQKEESILSEAPPAKGQVVGWPPIRSYRKNTLAARSADDCNRSAVYVKVNMDGVPIGRKVDLNACNSYEGLSQALEEMFANNGYGTRYLKGSEYALTYEDKEGDWMLVGDVPWGMFVNTVRRLRIIQGSEVTGLREFKSS